MKGNLVWNVYRYNPNKKSFESFNIFKHGGFNEYMRKILNEFKDSNNINEFSKRVHSELRYYFWSKTEYELIITEKENRIIMTPWVGPDNLSLDVTDNKDFDWIKFYDYIAYKKYAVEGSIKIDIYNQVMFKFDEFIQYCWNNR